MMFLVMYTQATGQVREEIFSLEFLDRLIFVFLAAALVSVIFTLQVTVVLFLLGRYKDNQ